MWKFVVLSTIVAAVMVESIHEPCKSHADCITHACPNHDGQSGACEFEHHHDVFGKCHCTDEHVHFCTGDSMCAGFPCPAGSTTRCSIHAHHHNDRHYCLCDY